MTDFIIFMLSKLDSYDPETPFYEVEHIIKMLKECGFDGFNPLYPTACHLFNRYYKENPLDCGEF